MAGYTRDDVATPYSVCKYCKAPTRSHVLEPALYEDFKAEVVINRSDEYANSHWEEVEDVIKSRKTADPVVVCHKCWLKRKEELAQIIDNEYDSWMDETMSHINRIQSVAHSCKYYDFGGEMETKMKTVVKKVREMIKSE